MTSILVHGAIRLREGEVERVRTLARAFVDEVHRESGCVAYELSWDNADPHVLRLLEEWESADAYEVHRAQPHVARWGATMLEVQDSPMVAAKFIATSYVS